MVLVAQRVPWDQAGLPVQSGLVTPSFLDPPEPPGENNQAGQTDDRFFSHQLAVNPLQVRRSHDLTRKWKPDIFDGRFGHYAPLVQVTLEAPVPQCPPGGQ